MKKDYTLLTLFADVKYELETSEPFESGTKKYENITPIKFNKVKQITFIKEVF